MSKRAREDNDSALDDERKDANDDKVLATRWGGWLQNLQDLVVDDWRTEAQKTAVFVEAIQAMEQCENWIAVRTVAMRLRGTRVVDQANSPLLDELVKATDEEDTEEVEDNQYLRSLAAKGTDKSWSFLMSRKYPPILADLKGCLRAALEHGNLKTIDFLPFPWQPRFAHWALQNGRDFVALQYLQKGHGFGDKTTIPLIVAAASTSCQDTLNWLLKHPVTLLHKQSVAKGLENETVCVEQLVHRSDTKILQALVDFGVDVKESFWECATASDPVKVTAWFLTTYPDLNPWVEEPRHRGQYQDTDVPYLAYLLAHRPREHDEHELAFVNHIRYGSTVAILRLLWTYANTPAYRSRFATAHPNEGLQSLILIVVSERDPAVMEFLLNEVGYGMSAHPEQIIALLLLVQRDCMTQVCLNHGLVIPTDCAAVLQAIDQIMLRNRGYEYPTGASLRSMLFDRGGDPASCIPHLLTSASTWRFRKCLRLFEAGVPVSFLEVAQRIREGITPNRYHNHSAAVLFLAKVLATQNTPSNCALFLEFVQQAPYTHAY